MVVCISHDYLRPLLCINNHRNGSMNDSRGRKSKTLIFVSIAFAVTTAKFAVGGVETEFVSFQEFGGGEYAAAIGAILGIWLGREYTEKVGRENANNTNR